jgi:RNAse (barnase) inhibitor barstar
MASKYSVRLTADTKQHDQALKKSANEVYKYKQKVEKAKGGVMQFAGELAAAVITIETFKKIMSSTERTTDIFGSAMEQAKAAATGFFSTIANGNIGGFIESLKDLTKNAKEAYEALDALGTDKMWGNRRLASLDAQLAEAKLTNDTKKINVLLRERESIIKNLEGKTKEAAFDSLISALTNSDKTKNHQLAKRLQSLDKNDMEQIMYNLGRVGSTEDLNKLIKSYYQQNKQYIGYDSQGKMNNNKSTVIYEFYKQLSNIEESQLQAILALMQDADRLSKENARIANRYGEKTSSTTTKTPKRDNTKIDRISNRKYIQSIFDGLSEVEPELDEFGDIVYEKMELPLERVGVALEDVLEAAKQYPSEYVEIIESAEEHAQRLQDIFELQLTTINSMSSAFQTLGNTFDMPGLSAAGIISQAIANIIKGYSTASAQSATAGPWAWVAFTAAGLAEVASVISQIHSLSGFANGGIVGGNTTLGDHNLARVNAGEMILNTREQNRLWRVLNGTDSLSMNNINGASVTFKIKGSDLVGTIDNYNQKTRRVK